jgi:hypothetical protein
VVGVVAGVALGTLSNWMKSVCLADTTKSHLNATFSSVGLGRMLRATFPNSARKIKYHSNSDPGYQQDFPGRALGAAFSWYFPR